jgi:hypothetical protein
MTDADGDFKICVVDLGLGVIHAADVEPRPTASQLVEPDPSGRIWTMLRDATPARSNASLL